MRYVGYYFIVFLAMLAAIGYARASEVTTDFTACYTQEAMIRYATETEIKYRNRDEVRAEMNGQCVYDEMTAITGKPVHFFMRGTTCFRVQHMTIVWSKTEGTLNPPKYVFATAFWRCEAESA